MKVFIASSAQWRIFIPRNTCWLCLYMRREKKLLLWLCVLMCGTGSNRNLKFFRFTILRTQKKNRGGKILCNLLHFISNAHLNCTEHVKCMWRKKINYNLGWKAKQESSGREWVWNDSEWEFSGEKYWIKLGILYVDILGSTGQNLTKKKTFKNRK